MSDPRLDTYDWGEAFGCAGEPGHENRVLPDDCTNSSVPTGQAEAVTRDMVLDILALSDGEHDEQDWIGLFLLRDGRYLALRAGCDYSGWDCRSGGSSSVHSSKDDAIRFGLTKIERERLGLMLDEERPR